MEDGFTHKFCGRPHNFNRDFFEPMKDVKIFPTGPGKSGIDYTKLHNPFEVVSHVDNKGSEKRNPQSVILRLPGDRRMTAPARNVVGRWGAFLRDNLH